MPNATKRKKKERCQRFVLDQPVKASVEFAQRKKETNEREKSREELG